MKLSVSLSAVLAGVLCMLSVQEVDAVPLNQRAPRFVTLPLKRVQLEGRSGVHGQIYLQQHMNRAIRRLARMTKREEPSHDDLYSRMERRVLAIEGPEGLENLERRYNRIGVPKLAQTTKTPLKKATTKNAVAPKKATTKNAVDPPQKATTKNAVNPPQKATTKNAVNPPQNATTKNAVDPPQKATTKNVASPKKPDTLAAELFSQKSQAHEGNTKPTSKGLHKDNGQSKGNNTIPTGTILAVAVPEVTADTGDVAFAAVNPTASDSLGLDIEAQDVGYLATVQIGTPPRDFLILMDSGSADFWVGAENCVSEGGGGCGQHNFLGPQSSSTFVSSGNTFSVTYGTGDVSGDIITDDITLASLALPGHQFGVATSESVDFSADTTPFDGLMGLAKSTLSEQGVLTPVESLHEAGLISESIVSYKISRLADDKNDGEITFGALDPAKFVAGTEVTLPNVNAQGFWEADLQTISVNGQDTGLTGRTAILDTGTTLIVAPAADAQAVHNLIQGAKSDGQGGFTVPCTLTDSVALTFGGSSFAIDPRDIAFTPVDPNDPTGDCVSGITSGDIGGADEWLVGDVFLKNAYFSTDVTKNIIILAQLA
ncbi:putative aspartic-type endopeptidase CTSD [Psilocybe cubensis]|uniref:Peptidase A1 domain-containing protein n=2 Tax=Psilocybe cubensis TaxID=181762 RepID=A0A8H8CM24_PSICU|nr:putative aspartic-type endopeptidase CTSD [Psilocybe cubensis]KAH9481637.1 putative aspartic-type endopeptidase CTSD [Psilocybe cubensis]